MLYAAVVIPIVRYEDPAIVLVKRAAHLRRNPGQIAFPGGIVDPDDADERAAALREFEEEMGIPRTRVTVFDRLDDVVTLALSVTVSPYLGFVDPPFDAIADARETEAIYEIPLREIYAPNALHRGIERVTYEGTIHDVPSWLFDYGDVHVWGASARMLHGLVARYPDARFPNTMTLPISNPNQ
jgi:8-oxo-dGTP pyrophosphatase MutT (NUDIX family)